ncbi:MAG: calcium/sodium antiporter [Paracoccus sp. (in: a-proteobacteria)]|nr:calcium/sodium antiporter [Paracoccus sp. (in: a-proteobacteria)]
MGAESYAFAADLGLIVAGLVLLVLGGEQLVRGAVALALRLGIAPVIVGLTVVAFGTSAPEMIVSVNAALRGSPGIALGNVVGSNIANVLVILGLTALIAPIATQGRGFRSSWFYMVAASVLLIVLCLLGPLHFWHGVVLLAGMALVLSAQIGQARRYGSDDAPEDGAGRISGARIALLLAVGLVLLPLGARLLVSGATDIARGFGISEAVIGLTLVALGTSLPELAASVVAARRGQSGIALGNVIGSNIFNILAIMGITSFFGPLHVPPEMMRFDLWLMLACAVVIAPFLFTGRRIGRVAGGALLAAYAIYVGYLLI